MLTANWLGSLAGRARHFEPDSERPWAMKAEPASETDERFVD